MDEMEFERLVLGLLRAEALAADRQFLIGPEAGAENRYFDGVFPTGYGDLPGPTVVEVKYRAHVRSVHMFLNRSLRSKVEYGSILLVIHGRGRDVERARKYLEDKATVPVRVMSSDDVQTLAKKHPAMALTYDMKFLSDAIDAFESRDVSRYTQQHIGSLKSAFKEDQLVIFVGAGVSLSAGLPDWPSLLNRLTLDLMKTHPDIADSLAGSTDLLEYLREESPSSPIIAARFLRDSIDKFADRVRRALYETYNGDSHSDLIRAIGKLCLPERARQGLLAVVNYNFDNLIEIELDRRNVNHHVVICEEDSPSRDELPIYHPHGFLPSKGKLTATHEASLVLSEDAYHSQFIDPYSWPNITQLNLLRNHVCLFLGLSMTDPNLRRLLEISQRKKPGARHYAVLRDHWKPSGKRKTKATTLVSRVFRGLEETSFARLGVSVIWVQDYADIPKVVSQIRD
ncbi:SIR2 family protein [bacterium]|nr:SIR2 family protein [bacterium]